MKPHVLVESQNYVIAPLSVLIIIVFIDSIILILMRLIIIVLMRLIIIIFIHLIIIILIQMIYAISVQSGMKFTLSVIDKIE